MIILFKTSLSKIIINNLLFNEAIKYLAITIIIFPIYYLSTIYNFYNFISLYKMIKSYIIYIIINIIKYKAVL